MKETVLSTCEKEFVPKAISEGRRLDSRNLLEYRKLQIVYGGDWGCCMVSLGKTKVLAQASCEIQQPKSTRPNEGILFVNVEFSPMGAPHFEIGRPTDAAVQCNRLLEKCLKESRCVDLESLCIVADEKVWQVRVDVSILNHDGALVDAASIAALAALAHFRRPDVTLDGEERSSRARFSSSFTPSSPYLKNVVVDPAVLEERTAEAQIVVGINAYRELTALHLGGTGSPATNQLVMHCASLAAVRAMEVVRMMKDELAKDAEARVQKSPVGFVQSMDLEKVTTLSHEAMVTALGQLNMNVKMEEGGGDAASEGSVGESAVNDMIVESVGENSAELVPENDRRPKLDAVALCVDTIGSGGPSTWGGKEEDEEPSSEEEEVQVVAQLSPSSKPKPPVEEIELSESEEEEIHTLQPEEMNLDKGLEDQSDDEIMVSKQNTAQKKGRKKRKKKNGDNICK
ncbi:hypothetical protein J437_LFUL003227 [Ladona fulva]|uniref:Exosome complex component RRP45 n=1 Tax=Ladona fulva TaxID=123851 RepID=A0A8K0JSG0_LADFU|nr:hypothetical protein J437_LFUL003227 [Ladona fulva]